MSAHQAVFPIRTMARVFKVSASGYYAWRGSPASARATADLDLTPRIRTIHAASRGTYGVPGVHAEFKADGIAIGKKRIARLMQAAHLVGAGRRRSITTTRRDLEHRPANDLVLRNFFVEKPNELWVADITFLPTFAEFLFLAVVMDAWSRRIVDGAFSTDLETRVVPDALDMALATRKPQIVIHYSDRGSQYTSLAFGNRYKDAGVRPSTGSVGDACDNAICESFFPTLECELPDQHRFNEAKVIDHRRFEVAAVIDVVRDRLMRDPLTRQHKRDGDALEVIELEVVRYAGEGLEPVQGPCGICRAAGLGRYGTGTTNRRRAIVAAGQVPYPRPSGGLALSGRRTHLPDAARLPEGDMSCLGRKHAAFRLPPECAGGST